VHNVTAGLGLPSFEDGSQKPRLDGRYTNPALDYSTMADAAGRGRGGFGRGRGDRGRGRGRGRRGGRKDEEKEWYAILPESLSSP